MRIEAVCVCVDYADYLEEVLPFLLPHVDDMVVVTTPEDGRTRKACARLGVRCLPTRCFHREGEAFNKARGINYGLANLKLDGWVLHIDADIVLPQRTRYLLNNMDLDARKLYGCDRVNCVGRAAWDDFKENPELQYEWRCLIKPPRRWPLGARIAHMEYGGYCPIGFFQLWSPRGSGITRYPQVCQGTAEHSDVLHAIQWDREDRCLIPELICVHLETKDKGDRRPMGQNWAGRTTPEFTRDEKPYRIASARPGGAHAASHATYSSVSS
jgi:hypothetical protein